MRPPLFALAAVLASDHRDHHRGISAALQKEVALAEVGLTNYTGANWPPTARRTS